MPKHQKGTAKSPEVRQRWYTPLIPRFGRQRQTDFCEFKATLGYTNSKQKQIQVVVVVHTLIPTLVLVCGHAALVEVRLP